MNLIEALAQAEACSIERAKEIATELGFLESQYGVEFHTTPLQTGGVMIWNREYGYISCGHAGEPMFSEDGSGLIPENDPAAYAADIRALGLCQ